MADGKTSTEIAYGIAAYVEKATDFENWSPRRAAYEAVMVCLEDEGASYDMLLHYKEHGKEPYGDLRVVAVDDG